MKNKSFLLLITTFFLFGCNKPVNVINHTVSGEFINGEFIFPMNTLVNLKMYDENQYNEVKDQFDDIVISLSHEADRYHNYENLNNLKTINDSCGSNTEIKVSDELFEMISLGVKLTKLTEGKFNLAMGNLIDLYQPLLEEELSGRIDTLPDKKLINKAMLSIPSYSNIDDVIVLNEENKTIKLNKYNDENVVISLGGIAKGFTMDKVYSYLKEKNYPCLFDAGSSTMATINDNPSEANGNWRISFREPLLSQQVSVLGTINTKSDIFISTSADYTQNFFYEEDNDYKLMHHIIDPYKGVSNDYLRSVSLVSKNTSLAVLDALSTSLFNCYNDEQAISLINKINETYNCQISFILVKPYERSYDNYTVVMSKSFNELLASSLSNKVMSQNIIDNM